MKSNDYLVKILIKVLFKAWFEIIYVLFRVLISLVTLGIKSLPIGIKMKEIHFFYFLMAIAFWLLGVLFDLSLNFYHFIVFCLAIYTSFEIYLYVYFSSNKFLKVKDSIKNYIQNCNDLNAHIEDLKSTYLDVQNRNFGNVSTVDTSKFNFQRREWSKIEISNQVYNCSLVVCRNAVANPFKYLCKYFDIEPNEQTLNKFSQVLNNFSSVEEGKGLVLSEKDDIIASIADDIPKFIVGNFNKRLQKELGFQELDLSTTYFPTFTFQYVSSGGNSSMRSDIVFDIENLNDFIQYLSKKIDYINSYQGQRSLMTTSLRDYVKNRDNYRCCNCGNGTYKEPNLLLEIDHIIPLSKGGLTKLDNLQTLCWRCNRSKGSKVL